LDSSTVAISLLPAPRTLNRLDGRWTTSDPLGDAQRALDPALAAAAYRIEVSPAGARLTAGAQEGLRLAESSFGQLVDSGRGDGGDDTGAFSVPAVLIEDEPAFAWRGVMLDVARHFLPKDFVLRLLDVLALHRLNVLHLHLTDDQGWRVQIDAYPRLTSVGGWRRVSMVGRMSEDQTEFTYDGVGHGGFYTKDDLREIVRYAAERGVTVVPEVDLPGHMQAAIAAYPELGTDPSRSVTVREVWGISEEVLGASDEALEFVGTVLSEVAELFPGPYVHIGGDECPTTLWEQSPVARERMAELGFTEPRQLQGWFTAHAAAVLAEHGKRLVGWDEILEAKRPEDAVVMAWRSPDEGVHGVQAGHEVVMAPSQFVYFDYYQADPAIEPLAIGGLTRLEDVFDWPVVPDGLSEEERARVIGAQCQLWTEYVPDATHAAYQLLPRLCAFAERAWGSPTTTYEEFTTRLQRHLPRVEELGLRGRPLD
jgi:hexosaminidase